MSTLSLTDTIAAIATPPGEGGIGIVRLSGLHARAIGLTIVKPSQATTWPTHVLTHGFAIEPVRSARIDEVMAVFMEGPRTFTAEDVFEIHCHGGRLPLRAVLESAVHAGARLANRGEFTLRAFLNGRLDLTQAEAVLDIIQARTSTGLSLAIDQLNGTVRNALSPIMDELLHVLAYLEASIDFVEEGIDNRHHILLQNQLETALASLRALSATSRSGILIREGIRTVIVGAPNVGKSSLLNRMLRVDRAIVTPIAGTTRDTLEETVDVDGIPVYLIDTAGLTDTTDPVERIGVERSRSALMAADVVLLVLDGSRALGDIDKAAIATVRDIARDKHTIVAINKSDLDQNGELENDINNLEWPQVLRTVHCSAATGQCIEDLSSTIVSTVAGPLTSDESSVTIDNSRHQQALNEAIVALQASVEGLNSGLSQELVCSDVRASVDALGSITGQNIGEDVLDRIFSKFCIGK